MIFRSFQLKTAETRVLEGNARVTGNISGFISCKHNRAKNSPGPFQCNTFPCLKMLPDQVSGLMDKLQGDAERPISAKGYPQIVSWVTKNIQGGCIFWGQTASLIMGNIGRLQRSR
jgi:hypothetical protein